MPSSQNPPMDWSPQVLLLGETLAAFGRSLGLAVGWQAVNACFTFFNWVGQRGLVLACAGGVAVGAFPGP